VTEVEEIDAKEESESLRKTAEEAALSVGPLLMAAFRSAMDLDFKRDLHDVVTIHDKASEERIASVILGAVPDSTLVGEEGGRRGAGRVHWYVDPIDGTSNFARGIALWCVSIAAVIEGRVVAGVIYNPVAGDVFSADLNGAWLNDQPLIARATGDELAATIVSSFPDSQDLKLFGTEALNVHATLLHDFQAVRNLGSGALNLAHVAAGWADATMGFATQPWDVAAGVLILEQAGGTDYPTLRKVVESLSARGSEQHVS